MLVDQGKAEAALAWSEDQAIERSECLGQGANRSLEVMIVRHSYWMFLQ